MSKPQKVIRGGKPTGKWRIQWFDHAGERQSATYNSQSAATAALRAELVQADKIRAGVIAPPKPAAPTFAEFFASFTATYVQSNNKPSERDAKEKWARLYLLPALGAMPIDEIGLAEVERLKAALRTARGAAVTDPELARMIARIEKGHPTRDTLEPKTVNNVLIVLGTALRFAKRTHVLGDVPEIIPLKVMRPSLTWGATGPGGVMDFDESDRLVAAARATSPEIYAAVLLGVDAGLRAGEIRSLFQGDVDYHRGQVTVQRTDYRGVLGPPKGGRARVVPLTGRALEALRAIKHLRGPFVFCDASGAPWREREMDTAILALGVRARIPLALQAYDREREARRAYKIRQTAKETGRAPSAEQLARVAAYEEEKRITGDLRWGWHALRHAFCSHLAARGAHPKDIQELAGHSSLAVTERYMHFAPARARAAVELLEQKPPAAAKEKERE